MQFLYLLQKNFRLQSRRYCCTIFELLFPLIFIILIALVRGIILRQDYLQQQYPAVDVSAAGVSTDYICSDVAYHGTMVQIENKDGTIGGRQYEFLQQSVETFLNLTISEQLVDSLNLTFNAQNMSDSVWKCLAPRHQCFSWGSIERTYNRTCTQEFVPRDALLNPVILAQYGVYANFAVPPSTLSESVQDDLYDQLWGKLISAGFYLPYGVPSREALDQAKADWETLNNVQLNNLTNPDLGTAEQYLDILFALVDNGNLYMDKTIGYVAPFGTDSGLAKNLTEAVANQFLSQEFTIPMPFGPVTPFVVPQVGYKVQPFATQEELELQALTRNRPTVEIEDGDQEDYTPEEILEQFASTIQRGGNITLGIVYNSITEDNFDYTLRMLPKWGVTTGNGLSTFFTDRGLPTFMPLGSGDERGNWGREYRFHLTSGLVAFQTELDRAYTLYFKPEAYDNIQNNGADPWMRQIAYPEFTNDTFIYFIAELIPFIIWISFLFSIFSIVRELVFEKEARLREAMRMMGLSDWVNNSAWFVKNMIILFISTLGITIVAKLGGIIENSDPFLLFAFFYLYALALIGFGFLIASLFSASSVAGFASIGLYFLAFFPQFFVNSEETNRSMSLDDKRAVGLLFPTNMGLGMRLISQWENRGTGIQFDNWDQSVSPQDEQTMIDIFLMFVIDLVLYMVMAWWITNVFPGEYGIPKKPWFFLLPSFWFGDNLPWNKVEGEDAQELEMRAQEDMSGSGNFEEEPADLKPAVQIRGLTKKFKKGGRTIKAVDNMNLTMYEDQITALLGHNGAGKTTTISMLTGLFPASGGDAFVNGNSIRTEMSSVLGSIGICPQFDIVWPDMTVEEHLYFYARLKGAREGVDEEVTEMINDIGLPTKRKTFSKDLSGGMRRRLSVGMALIGGSKVVFLDEPTSGQDPHARRGTWDLLYKHKKGRTLVLTTHFMDEADLLGDRIAIMTDGRVQCCGTSLFLKSRYGSGYRLTIAKESEQTTKVDDIKSLVAASIPGSNCVSDVGTELAFTMPNSTTEKFAGMFDELDAAKEKFAIQSYGVAMTTMEEVFLKVGADSHDASMGKNDNAEQTDAVVINEQLDYTLEKPGVGLAWRQFVMMIRKRWWHAHRDYFSVIFQLLLPFGFILLALVTASFQDPTKPDPLMFVDPGVIYAGTIETPYVTDVDTAGRADVTAYAGAVIANYNSTVKDESLNPDILKFKGNLPFCDVDLMCAMDLYGIESTRNDVGYKQTRINTFEMLTEYSFDPEATTEALRLVIGFNPLAYHSLPIGVNTRSRAILNKDNAPGTLPTVIRASIFPFEASADSGAQAIAGGGFGSFNIAFSCLLGMAFLSSSFVLFLVSERASGAKHLQLTSGVSIVSYWVGHLAWDMFNAFLVNILLLVAFGIFEEEVPEYINQLHHVFFINILYIWGNMPLAYFISFAFDAGGLAFGFFFVINYLIGLGTLLVSTILSQPALGAVAENDIMKYVFLIFPSYAYPKAIADIYQNEQAREVCSQPGIGEFCESFGLSYTESPVDINMPGIGSNYLALTLSGFLWFGVLVVFEYLRNKHIFQSKLDGKSEAGEGEDEDVIAERQRIKQKIEDGTASDDIVSIRGLTKVFDVTKRPAVDDLWVGIPKSQCFGLLGINGAGKTTTFKMITGDVAPSAGDAYLNGYSSNDQLENVRQHVGYCPQFDALIPKMTGRETLKMYATLRGIPSDKIDDVVQEAIVRLDLVKHADGLSGSYSGGNKRKLSTAVAMIGNPAILLLDEPSTGMDPGARRFIWNTINQAMVSKGGRSIVLTSHSMEECEALCTRLAIMVNGQFKCMGSLQHLKTRFGGDVSLMLKTDEAEQLEAVIEWVKKEFPTAEMKDAHNALVEFSVSGDISWGALFGKVESIREELHVCDYGISQPTLEQIFLKFASAQTETEC